MDHLSCQIVSTKVNQHSNKMERCLFCCEAIFKDHDNVKDEDCSESSANDTFLKGISIFCEKLNMNWKKFSQIEQWKLIDGNSFVKFVCCQSCYKLLNNLVALNKLLLETQTALNRDVNKMKGFIVDSEEAHKEQEYSAYICNQFRQDVLKSYSGKCQEKTTVPTQTNPLSTKTIIHQKSNEEMPVPFVKLEPLDMSSLPRVSTNDATNLHKVSISTYFDDGDENDQDHTQDNDSIEIKGENWSDLDEEDNVEIPGSDSCNEKETKDNQQNTKMISYFCDLCGKGFINQWSIPLHKISAHPDGKIGTPKSTPFECEICGQRTTTKMSLLRHKKIIHATKKSSSRPPTKPTKFTCPLCPKSFKLKAVCDRHVKLTHKSTFSCVCTRCSMTFDTQRQLMHHKYETHKKHKMTPSFLKRLENAKSSTTTGDNDSTTDVTQQSCVICSQEFTSWGLLDLHLTQHENNLEEKSLMCYFCNHRFAHEQSLLAHLKASAAHYLTKVEFPCDHSTHLAVNQQQWVYADIKSLESHFKNDHKECRILKCGDCGCPFVDKNMLELHKLVHLPREKNYRYRCPVCQNTFVTTDSLQHHYNSCHGVKLKLHRCGICGWGFSSKTGYAQHMLRMHNDKGEETEEVDNKLHSCSECSKRFVTEIQLYNHKRQIHVTSQCSDCGEVMSKSKMSLHRRMKHNKEQHLCTKCGKAYKTASHLKQHMSSHGEYEHVCQYCGSGSRSTSHLRRHIKRMHKDQLIVKEAGDRENTV